MRAATTIRSALVALLTPLPVDVEAQFPLVELDHVYIVVPDHRAAIHRLLEAGLTIDTTTVMAHHDGAGTASTAAIFDNAYLEILWVEPSVRVSDVNVRNLDRTARAAAWSSTAPSPFGVGLRRTAGAPDSLPYRGARESPEWIEPGTSFFAFETFNDDEPNVFVVPQYMALTTGIEQLRATRPALLDHALGVRRLTHLVIDTDALPTAVEEAGLSSVEFRASTTPRLELIFDDGQRGATAALRPTLPLILRY
jgi:hypothetical protein